MKATGKHKDIRSRQARQSSYYGWIIFNCIKCLNIKYYPLVKNVLKMY